MTYVNIPGQSWREPVSTLANLPTAGNAFGDARVTTDTLIIYIWDGSAWQPASGGGGSSTWGSITGSNPQVPPSGGFTGTLVVNEDGTDAVILIQDTAFNGFRLTQDSISGNIICQVLDTSKNLRLLPGSVSGIASLGYLGGMGGFQAYTNIAYSIVGGNLGASADNSFSLGTDETGAFVNGNRWKDGVFATSLRSPLFTDVNQNSGGAATAITVTGVHNSGAGAGGKLILTGGTGTGGDGSVQLGNSATTPQHILNTSLATPAANVLTLTNGPAGTTGNATGYVQITINGTTRYIPFW